ncbi:hypothetical protein [Pseudonocardia acidicola]|uniref:Mce-associated membrane protein n=1 Tax=Pseudonocardia acidicola TaxID=2724939 RepID=A0ABX1SHT4_9PSEU|nr:hypothetical protein [Pseudonocardia acidicola]NMI01141.1 hypothetical protein [Pseudonocardia acidicola]
MTVLDPPRSDETEARPRWRRFRRPSAVRLLTVLVALAGVVAIVLGTLWVLASNDDSLKLAAARDQVLVEAQQAAITLNTLDYKNVDPGLDRWEQVSTGSVLDEFRTNRAQYAKFVTDSKRTTQATVSDAAVSEIDARAGVARVLVGVDVNVQPEGQSPVLTRQRLQLEMTRTDQGWKVSKLAPVPTPGSSG